MSEAPHHPGTLAAYWLAARPKTLPAAATPVVVGTAVAFAAGGLAWGPALAALVGALLIQVATNYANDLFDYRKGADDAARLGPTRAVQAGWLSERAMILGIAVVIALAVADGAYLVAVGGWPILVVGIVSILAGLAYTGGPFPLAYNALGDVFVFVFFGFVAVCGTVWVQLGALTPLAWYAGAIVGALSTAILVVNNVRDLEGDRRAGKRTLPVVFGRRFGVFEYLALLALAYVLPPVMLRLGVVSVWCMLCLVTLPLARRLAQRLHREREGAALNRLLAGTAQLLLIHGLLFSAGLVLPALL